MIDQPEVRNVADLGTDLARRHRATCSGGASVDPAVLAAGSGVAVEDLKQDASRT